ncbi:MAG: hypothetical protein AABY22_18580, partial [Nanoarchaeota archaeon]
MNKEDLYKFEEWTVNEFNEGHLKSPVHLSGSIDGKLEDYLIELFKQIKPNDWVATTYRSHYHALLKGVPEERLKAWISSNKSIHFMDKEFKMFSSAIVGGTLPTALGIALGLKLKQDKLEKEIEELKSGEFDGFEVKNIELLNQPKIWVFCGDMTAMTGAYHEAVT